MRITEMPRMLNLYLLKKLWSGKVVKSIALLFSFGMFVFILTQTYLNLALPHPGNGLIRTEHSLEGFHSRKVLCAGVDELSQKAVELEKQLAEMERIKIAGLNDLTRIEEKRFKLNEEIKQLRHNRDTTRENYRSLQKDVTKAKLELRKIKYSEMARQRQKIVAVGLPIRFETDKSTNTKFERSDTIGCSLEDCLDYSKCPFTSTFSFYIYNPQYYKPQTLPTKTTRNIYEQFLRLPYYTATFESSCVAVAIVDVTMALKQPNKLYLIEEIIQNLKYWNKNGQNHLLIFSYEPNTPTDCSIFEKIDTGMAMVVHNSFCKSVYRDKFDIILPQLPTKHLDKQHLKWKLMQPLLPLKRKYLYNLIVDMEFNNSFTKILKKKDLLTLGQSDRTFVQLKCSKLKLSHSNEEEVDCKDRESVSVLFKNSAFTVLFMDVVDEVSHLFYIYFFEALRSGSIPVLIGSRLPLPFTGLIDWNAIAVILPLPRLPELNFILHTLPDENLFQLKKQGRFIWETYFSSTVSVIETAFAVLRSRMKIPPFPYKDFHALPVDGTTKKAVQQDSQAYTLPSKTYAHNWTYLSVHLHDSWNMPPGAHRMMSSYPFVSPLPSSIQFTGNNEYAPVGDGNGGDGVPFAKSLGGDFPMEHFTIVLLTYDREVILVESLQRLTGLKYLNRVIVVWNNPAMPSPELKWPDIGVELHVVRPGANSLNNRFLPYDLIDTDAVLSMDDDIYLRHDEIELAFRVWRENRDRIVGFPGRFHSWDSRSWYYNANYSCELSMVLTGGAFFHKFYSYLYTYTISPSVRNMIDDFMNCEDIAMNFLVAHVTGKQPIKVTSRWTFRCPGCPTSLSGDESHFSERGKCIQYFEEVFGYMPLRKTQFRADSVLFKTRLPPGRTKCYQFV